MPTKPETKPTATKKSPDDAARVGRLVRTLQRIESDRDTELATAPQSIHARAQRKIEKATAGIPGHIVNAAVAAVGAMRPVKESEGEE